VYSSSSDISSVWFGIDIDGAFSKFFQTYLARSARRWYLVIWAWEAVRLLGIVRTLVDYW